MLHTLGLLALLACLEGCGEATPCSMMQVHGQAVVRSVPGEEKAPPGPARAIRRLETPPERPPGATPKKLYEAYCSPCHDLGLVQSQRLDRANWEWVMSDMVLEYGATWITEEEQKVIVDYLAENFGPKR